MIYLVSMITVLAIAVGAVSIIWSTLSKHADAIVAALAGRSILATSVALPARGVRVTIRPAKRRLVAFPPLRAAA